MRSLRSSNHDGRHLALSELQKIVLEKGELVFKLEQALEVKDEVSKLNE